jgi:hypothetical protein
LLFVGELSELDHVEAVNTVEAVSVNVSMNKALMATNVHGNL